MLAWWSQACTCWFGATSLPDALRVAAHVLAHLDRLQFGSTSVDCNALLDLHCAKILSMAQSIMKPPEAADESKGDELPRLALDHDELMPFHCCAFMHVGVSHEVTLVDASTLIVVWWVLTWTAPCSISLKLRSIVTQVTALHMCLTVNMPVNCLWMHGLRDVVFGLS